MKTEDIDKIIDRLGIDLLRDLHAIAWFCDATTDGMYECIPASRIRWYEAGGDLHALAETGCIKTLRSARFRSINRRTAAIRVEPVGRTVLCRCAARGMELRSDDVQSAA